MRAIQKAALSSGSTIDTTEGRLGGNRRGVKLGREVATYDYTDLSGDLLFQVVRYEPKTFRQRQPYGRAGWTWNMDGVERVLFRLPELRRNIARDAVVIIAEGERDVLMLVEHGFVATCNCGGAGKWEDSYSKALRGADVVIIADKDKAGRDHAQLVASKLDGVSKRVRVLELPGIHGKEVKDATDFFEAGGTADQVRDLIRTAKDWTPLVLGESEGLHSSTSNSSSSSISSTAGSCVVVKSIQEAVRLAVPTCKGRNHRKSLPRLAGLLKAFEVTASCTLTNSELRSAILDWHKRSGAFLKASQSAEDYYIEFMDAWKNIRPMTGSLIDLAWQKSGSAPTPPEASAAGFTKPKYCRLISFCHQFQLLKGRDAFELSPGIVAGYFNVSTTTAQNWMGGLVALKVLTKIKPGDFASGKAASYRFNFIAEKGQTA